MKPAKMKADSKMLMTLLLFLLLAGLLLAPWQKHRYVRPALLHCSFLACRKQLVSFFVANLPQAGWRCENSLGCS